MGLAQEILARVRSLAVPFYAETDDQQPGVNERGELLVAQALPPLVEVTRQGDTWQVISSAGLAALTALPTTTAGLSLWNGETGTKPKSLIIEAFGSVEEVIDATQADTTAIFACNNITPVTAPTDAALSIRSTVGRKYGGHARTLAAGAIVNDGWFPHGPQSPLAPAVAGANWKINECSGPAVAGLYIVPPGGMFNVQAVKAGAAAAAQQFFFIRWHEALFTVRT